MERVLNFSFIIIEPGEMGDARQAINWCVLGAQLWQVQHITIFKATDAASSNIHSLYSDQSMCLQQYISTYRFIYTHLQLY